MDNTGIELPGYITDARNNAQAAASSLSQFYDKGGTITEELRKVLTDALTGPKTELANMKSTALNDYFAAPATAYEKFSSPTINGQSNPDYILNPMAANKAIQLYVGSKAVPYDVESALWGWQNKDETSTIDAGVRAFEAHTKAAEAAAQAARQVYSDVLNEFKMGSDIAATNRGLDIQQQQVNKSGEGTSYSQQQAEDKKRVIIEASKAKTDEDKRNYIASQGYNPGDADFSGLYTPATDYGAEKTKAEIYKNAGLEITVDPSTGKVTPKAAPTKNWWEFWK